MSAGDWKEMLLAAQEGNLELVQYHIHMGVNPNYQHPEFLTTPLIESVEAGHVEVAKFLLEHGADPHLKAGFSTDSALSVAKKYRNKTMIKLLRAHTKPSWWRFFYLFDNE